MDPYEHRSEDGFLRRGGRKKRKRKPRPLWKRVGGKTNSRGNRAPLSIDLEEIKKVEKPPLRWSLFPPYFSLIFQTRSKLLSRFPKLSKFLYFPSPLHFLPSSLSPSSPSPLLQRLFPPRDTTTRKLHWDSELQRMQFVIGGRGGGGGEKVEIWNSRKWEIGGC